MAGIYIHIPFCKQRCTYCDFYKEISLEHIAGFVNTLIAEMHFRKEYMHGASISTIYFGGGTPSVLHYNQLKAIFDSIFAIFQVDDDAEITMEANPDDLSDEYLQLLSQLPFNRLSIGVQSFDDKELKSINRRHTAQQAKDSVLKARKHGFENISIDLIYALPGQTLSSWEMQLHEAFALEVEHIAAYGLTYEKGTALWRQRNKGLVQVVEDEVTLQMYNLMRLKMNENGFDAYEISNFAKPGFRSQHNSAYWKFIPYIGLGPSAHSFDGNSRQWNIASVKKYMDNIATHKHFYEQEILTSQDFYNDFVMVSLRTSDGIDLELLEKKFGKKMLDFCLVNASKHLKYKNLVIDGNKLYLSLNGLHISNLIIMDLMKTD